MKDNRKGLRLCPKAGLRQSGAGVTEKPPMDLPTVIFVAIISLIFGVYLGVNLKDLSEGKQPPVFDVSGAPEPCAPPSQGIWPDCRVPGQK